MNSLKLITTYLALLALISSCSTLKCLSIDGKASSSCKAFVQYGKYCKDRGGVKYGNALSATCNDWTVIEREY